MKNELFRKIVQTHGRASLIVQTWRATSLLLLLLATAPAFAQTNGVTISNFAAAPGTGNAPTTLTFNIEWKKLAPDVVWSDTVWVFVDYNNAGTMTRLPLAPGATLTNPSWEYAQVMEVENNDQGVWVVGNARARGSFSATVQLCTDVARHVSTGMCVYAINYPPVGRYTAADKIQFNGTPPFYLTYSGGGAATVTREQAQTTYTLTGTLASFTDASLAPGVTFCKVPNNPSLLASSTGYCSTDAGVTLALASPEAGATYLLYKGDNQTATIAATGGAATFSGTHAAGSYTVRVKESAAFCAATVTGTLTINVNPTPTAPIISQPTNICLNGGSLTFVASDYIGALTWTATGGGAVSGNTVTVSGTATGTKSVAAVSQQTYTDAPTCCSATVTKSATVHPLPDPPTLQVTGQACGATTVSVSSSLTSLQAVWTSPAHDGASVTVSSSTVCKAYTKDQNACVSPSATISVNVHTTAGDGAAPDYYCGCQAGLTTCSGSCATPETATEQWVCTDCTTASGTVTDQCGSVSYKTKSDDKCCTTWTKEVTCEQAKAVTGSGNCDWGSVWYNACVYFMRQDIGEWTYAICVVCHPLDYSADSFTCSVNYIL